MVANMKAGKMDGFCVGEPWNGRAVSDGIGYTAVTTQNMWRDHPEKACAFTEEFATKNPKTVKAILKALHLVSQHIDKMENRAQIAATISKPSYLNCPPEIILDQLQGKYDYGNGIKEQNPNYMIFAARNCNAPLKSYGHWWLSQFRRWGMVKGPQDYTGIVNQVIRPDLYLGAISELGVKPTLADMAPIKLADGVFDPKDPEKYAKSFPIHSLVG